MVDAFLRSKVMLKAVGGGFSQFVVVTHESLIHDKLL
jgi:hypothetical protein